MYNINNPRFFILKDIIDEEFEKHKKGKSIKKIGQELRDKGIVSEEVMLIEDQLYKQMLAFDEEDKSINIFLIIGIIGIVFCCVLIWLFVYKRSNGSVILGSDRLTVIGILIALGILKIGFNLVRKYLRF